MIRDQQFIDIFHDCFNGDLLHAGEVVFPLFRTFMATAGMAGLRCLDEYILGIVRIEPRYR